MRALAVAADLLREARARRWTLALAAATTLLLLLVAFGLQLEVVDGALAASRFFGSGRSHEIRAADVALRPLFQGVAWLVYGGGLVFGVLACADFAPTLLAPGRIEHLLSLPVRRWELLAGTWLGVVALTFAGALYGGLGLSLVVSWKTGVFGWGPVAAAALAALAFGSVYAVMVLAAALVRSAALSAAAGAAALVLFGLAGARDAVAPAFSPGVGRTLFLALTAPLPRLGPLGEHAARLAAGEPARLGLLAAQGGGALLVALAVLAAAVAILERKDF
jgi:Cu-processing system permease protein